ncbi:sushi, von Willebrand factor type A, EGF and pentraxin domain-containing protein 1-like [Varroa jacobsoni]|uniref:sushi, von Willebrand factor type A, EGF and pentraxin domain-containing protein 1-like n=1 Tax=Varroa jacobsoni TaxID=62625 RepID=UPI000BF93625|nr:sushi, von Willebrand factor type A, EGF and pentraxin domain-containing protein 1-like [Varroa jacobsoni]
MWPAFVFCVAFYSGALALDRLIPSPKQARHCVNRTCGMCPAGTYAGDDCQCCMIPGYCPSSETANFCVSCPPGSFSASQGARECKRCPAGFYVKGRGATECPKCPPGTYCNTPGCTECTSCPPGTEAPVGGKFECSPCPPGTMKPHAGAGSCIRCRKGAYNVDYGSTSCSDCPAGFFCTNQWQAPIECPDDSICPEGSHRAINCRPPLFARHGYQCYLADPIIALIVSTIILSTLGGMFAIARYYVRQTRRYSVNQETASLMQAHNNSQMNSTLSGF